MVDFDAVERMKGNLRAFDDNARRLHVSLESLRLRGRAAAEAAREIPAHTTPLTAREIAILRLVADGRDNAEIAAAMHFGLGTIKVHVREILEKLSATSRTEAAVRAVRAGLI
jgi:DNA-binding NarL/FixJ family response regulator